MFKVVHAEADVNAALPIERAALAAVGAQLVGAATLASEVFIEAARDADIVLTENTTITPDILNGLKQCKAVVMYSIGLDHVDLQTATELGIVIAHTPGFCVDEVSNHAMMFVLACARRLLSQHERLRAGWWPEARNLEAALTPMGNLRGECLGLLSFGAIARSLAHKAQAFGLRLVAFDPFVSAEVFAQHGVQSLSLDEVLAQSDYLSVHTPVTAATKGMLGETQLRKMKPSAFLINTSRGSVVDEAALVRALREGWIVGAALDVFEQEPPDKSNPLLHMSDVIVTPHSAYCSNASYARVRQMAADEAVRVLRVEWPLALANPAVKGRSRMEGKA